MGFLAQNFVLLGKKLSDEMKLFQFYLIGKASSRRKVFFRWEEAFPMK